jgi:hypothetical protein
MSRRYEQWHEDFKYVSKFDSSKTEVEIKQGRITRLYVRSVCEDALDRADDSGCTMLLSKVCRMYAPHRHVEKGMQTS